MKTKMNVFILILILLIFQTSFSACNSSSSSNKASNDPIQNNVNKGDVFKGLTVVSIDKKEDSINDITFSGSIELNGSYHYDNTGDGEGFIFSVDKKESEKIPVLKDLGATEIIVLSNVKYPSSQLPGKSGKSKISIKNLSLGERQIIAKADLYRVIK